MNKQIVVLGSLNMDVVVSVERNPEIGETIFGERVEYVSGGKGANQAVGLHQLGADVKLLGSVGTDIFGERIMNSLDAYGLDSTYIQKVQHTATGIANIIRTPDDNQIIVIPGANEQTDPHYLEQWQALIRGAALLLVQFEVPIKTVEYALSVAKQAGVTTVVNPAPAQKLDSHFLQLVDYITPNQTELATIMEGELPLSEVFAQWYQMYRTELIVTLGAAGCAYLKEGEVKIVPAQQLATVKDTTGAGDAFNAGFAYGLVNGLPISKAIAYANTVAALAVTQYGAQAGMPSLAQVNQYFS